VNASTADDIGYDAAHFERLAARETTHFWFVSRNALLVWAIRKYFPEARTFLEAGCGTGQVAMALQRAIPTLQLTAAEAFIEGLEIASRRVPGAELVQADVRNLPFEAEFDVVGAFDVLEHVRDDAAAMRELAKAVRPGGGVLVTVPQHDFLWSAVDERAGHTRRYSSNSLKALMSSCGLTLERTTSFVSLLLPAMLASRLTQRGSTSHGELYVKPMTNRIGRWVMTIERAMIRAGVSLPFGGSLLAVARRAR
jgi:SAM-dependent methyltransferase